VLSFEFDDLRFQTILRAKVVGRGCSVNTDDEKFRVVFDEIATVRATPKFVIDRKDRVSKVFFFQMMFDML
jgi:hypothetical protein